MCKEQTLCTFCTCKEWTHLMSAVGFGFSYGLVILENLRIDLKIMGIACVRSWHWKYFSSYLYINKSPLLVKTSYVPVHTSHTKCWPFKYWWSALSSKVCKKIGVRSRWSTWECVCVFVTLNPWMHHHPKVHSGYATDIDLKSLDVPKFPHYFPSLQNSTNFFKIPKYEFQVSRKFFLTFYKIYYYFFEINIKFLKIFLKLLQDFFKNSSFSSNFSKFLKIFSKSARNFRRTSIKLI